MSLLILLLQSPALSDEGMYPLSEISKLDLRSLGIELGAGEIYNPDSIDLSDAVVDFRGCTGSFVSAEGLILTNHHCAFKAIQAASTTERDYLARGFVARTREEEIPAAGQTARIRESARDISVEVLGTTSDTSDPAERTRRIGQRVREIVAEAQRQNPGKTAEVAEMFPGRTYVLFVYTTLRDIRLVYAPPRSIGEFGGEEDNWVWPRHTGDFTFFRAYAEPDGSPAAYSPSNVPYRPRKVLKVQPGGVDEGDVVFILGYPGRTARHQPAAFLAFEQNTRMPFVVDLFEHQIRVMEAAGEHDSATALKLAPRIKTLANTMKNNKGKLQGLIRLDLLGRKQREEKEMQEYIDRDPGRNQHYGRTLAQIGELYSEITRISDRDLLLEYLTRTSILLDAGRTLFEASLEREKPDSVRALKFMDKNIERTRDDLLGRLRDYHAPTDKVLLRDLLLRAARLPERSRIPGVEDVVEREDPEGSIDRFLERLYRNSRLDEAEFVRSSFASADGLEDALNDPFVEFAASLHPTYLTMRQGRERRDSEWSRFSASLLAVKEQFIGRALIPDANNTMRFTHGRVRGYSPADAVYCEPITTVTGLLEKTTDQPPFETPSTLKELHREGKLGRYRHPRLHDVPVALLYNLDTVGGNSGSPLMNARGELVGVNFDRAYEATINDYAWNESYSRSIAVDIRYVLWVTENLGGGGHVLQEMGVPLSP